MNLNEYQEQAYATATYPESANLMYPILGLASEAGEVAGKMAKLLRGDTRSIDKMVVRESLIAELGDCLWMIAAAAEDMGVSLEFVAQENLKKLASRQARGVIKGDGDNR